MTVYRTPHEKRPILNLAWGFMLAIALAILAIVLALPNILSTAWGQGKILEYTNRKIPGKIAAANLHFSWLGPQSVDSFALVDPHGKQVLRGEKGIANVPFWSLIGRNVDSGEIRNLNADILVSSSGESNLQIALGLIPTMETPLTKIKLQEVNASIQPGQHITASGKTQVNNTPGHFTFKIQDDVWTGEVDNFPVELLSQAAGGQDLKNLLGETFDLELKQHLAANARLIEGKITSTTLQAHVQGTFDPNHPEQGEGTIQLLQFTPENIPSIGIKDVLIPWKSDGKTLQFSLQGSVGNGRLQGGGTLSQEAVQINLNLLAIPTPLVESLIGTGGLSDLLGPSLDLKGEINSLEKMDLIVRGDQWSGKAVLVKEDGWKLSEPAVASFTVTPKRFAVIRNWIKKGEGEKFSLQTPAQLQIKVSEIGIPEDAHWTESYLDGSISIDQLTVLDTKTEQMIQLNDIQGDLTSRNLSREVQFNLQGKQVSDQGAESDLRLKGTLKEGWLKNGNFNKERFSFHGGAEFKNLPAGMICEILCFEEVTRAKMEALFGPSVNGSVQAALHAMEGPIQLVVEGSQGNIRFDGQLNKNHLALRSPFQLQLTPSPELGESVLKDLLPILNSMVRGSQKIQLTIDPTGFYLPLKGANLDNIRIGLLTLSLGRLEFQKDGQMGKIVSLISPSSDNIIPVWFTPIYISAEKGVVQVQRFDMLALDRFPLALWGTIDLPDDQIKMVVGLSGRALQSAFRVKVPDPDYMMQFPLRGPIGDASIDKSRAGTRIAALTAQAAGGPQGLVLGTVLGLASGIFSDPKPPAPTTDPLPWSTHLQETGEEEEVKTKNPMKALEKGLEKGIKKLFNK